METKQHGQSNGSFEDQLRRMILRDGPTSDNDGIAPKVRLPPAQQQSQHAPGMQPFSSQQRQYGHLSSSTLPYSNGHASVTASMPPGFPSQPHQAPPLPPRLRSPQHRQDAGHREPVRQYGALPPQPLHHTRGQNARRGPPHGQGQWHSQQMPLDPNAFGRGHQGNGQVPQPRTLYNPNGRASMSQYMRNDQRDRAVQYLDSIASTEVPNVEMSAVEYQEKESFRESLQKLCHDVCEENSSLPKVSLECFGSFRSGFASAGSDMDLVIVVNDQASTLAAFSLMEEDLPRALERKLLRAGHGARLLTRTRVPIIKVCEKPSTSLLDRLRAERERWDFLPNEKKYPHLHQANEENDADETANVTDIVSVEGVSADQGDIESGPKPFKPEERSIDQTAASTASRLPGTDSSGVDSNAVEAGSKEADGANAHNSAVTKPPTKTWTRERKAGPLDFPKDGIGIQCDINFFNPLGLHNTQMLRCYSLCDPRVRPIVLFVKSWAKLRGVNSSYSGTLSSYGYVLMVLHYLMNVAQPPVLPNLQSSWRPHPGCTPKGATAIEVDGWNVDFWRNEEEIMSTAQTGQMSTNREPVGALLLGFFEYFASQSQGPRFHWMNEVLSLRSPGGILSKAEKGWVKATTEEGEGKRVQHRYLFCIEDPFELSHNVARTVTHNGIVAIRDEFRRAHRILQAIGWGRQPNDGHLFDHLAETEDMATATAQLKIRNGPFISDQADGRTSKSEQDHQGRPIRAQQQRTFSGGPYSGRLQPQKVKAKALNLADREAFPSLGAGPAKKSRQSKASISTMNGEGSITGDKAQAYLEEFRRKKAEQEAEHTAFGAAEAVLGGDD